MYLATVLLVGALGVFVGYLFTAVRNGPGRAARLIGHTLRLGWQELRSVSLRRVYAMSRLAFQESVRRKVVVVFGLFLLLLMFAAWFLDRGTDHPARLYLSFVLTSTNYLILILAVLLGTFSLPADIKNRTIYTIVTKPVRGWEIVLGRILGFVAIGTLFLVVMSLLSYLFVIRGLDHRHEIVMSDLTETQVEQRGNMVTVRQGETSVDNPRRPTHRHEVTINPDGSVAVEANEDHIHLVSLNDDGSYEIGAPAGQLQARIPRYGKLHFLGRDGKPKERGVNVGNEWGYRSYIEGQTLATAIWTFDGITEREFKEGVPLEMTLRVFRTYKGEIERGIFGSIQVVETVPDDLPVDDPRRDLEQRRRFEAVNFVAQEFTADQHTIPRKYQGIEPDGSLREMDLFQDLIHDGKFELWITCGERAQYFGAAQADIYIRAREGYFGLNFVKSFLGIWFQMVIITSFSVVFSTFLNGAVSLLATIASFVLGFFANFVVGLQTGKVEGGGPIEAMVRLFTQKNQTLTIDAGAATPVMKAFDYVLTLGMRAISSVMPNYGDFNTSRFLAYGFDIDSSLIGQHAAITLGFVVALTTVGYFFFKTREIAA